MGIKVRPRPDSTGFIKWQRLIRFLSAEKQLLYGEPILPPGATSINQASHARVLSKARSARGWLGFRESSVRDHIVEIKTFLSPIGFITSPVIRCLGLNYRSHAAEANLPIPTHPVLFYKPTTALNHPYHRIRIPRVAHAHAPPTLDYECELVVFLSRPCKDVPEDKALDYVAGYCVGNDVSHRDWQLKHGGGQWGFGKSFDGFAPVGPGLVAPEMFGDKDPGQCTRPGSGLKIWTKLNGETVQEGWTGDMIFGVAKTIAFLSQGTRLPAGSAIFMGTPAGVGMSRNPPLWMKDGDVVEVGLEGVGTCVNTVEFVQEEEKNIPHEDGKDSGDTDCSD